MVPVLLSREQIQCDPDYIQVRHFVMCTVDVLFSFLAKYFAYSDKICVHL